MECGLGPSFEADELRIKSTEMSHSTNSESLPKVKCFMKSTCKLQTFPAVPPNSGRNGPSVKQVERIDPEHLFDSGK